MNELQRRTHNKHKLRYTTQNTLWFIFLNTLRFPVIYSDYLLLFAVCFRNTLRFMVMTCTVINFFMFALSVEVIMYMCMNYQSFIVTLIKSVTEERD